MPDNKALPVVCNQKMNVYLHELCELAGFNEPIRLTYYRGNERIDVVKPKYKLIRQFGIRKLPKKLVI